MRTMLENIKKIEADFLSAMDKMNLAHSTVDDILKKNTDDEQMSVDEAFAVSINLDIAKNEYLHARKIQADLDGLIEIFVEELKKFRAKLSASINQSGIEHTQKMMREKYDSSGGRDFELAIKLLTRDLLDSKVSAELAEEIFEVYGITLSHDDTVKDALDAAYQKNPDKVVCDE